MTPELLAPAGDRRALRAALAAGADAVYFGLERWSARAFAGNFALEHAVEAVELAHLYGARAHLALNTALKDDEVEPALAALEAAYAAGLDALIVADLGFAARAREEYPGLPLHASTQMNTHSSAQLAALAGLGFDRAILARELSLDEIAALEAHGLELEAFVHGALCYGYSGDCLLSSMVGGRSGNRGRCSQSCRMRYGVSVQGSSGGGSSGGGSSGGDSGGEGPAAAGAGAVHGAPAARVMSTADLCAIGALPQLLAAGVRSFKIEGRMKDAAYVAVTTSVYREALDAAAADPYGYRVLPVWLERLEQAFSRGFTAAHLEGRHHEVRSGGRGGHRGVLVGRVERIGESGGAVIVRLAKPVAEGDTLAVYTPWGQTEPFRAPETAADRLTLRLRERVAVKDRVFRLAAAEADALAHDLVAGRA
ncbi:MAG TPA: U32 family peptidase, partial [Thermoleophilia bacterium]|nr:U32 family peptidase [Thermoleophilia bacterium]